MKGISTVIATLLMLIITIALAGLAYSYISGVFSAKTGKVVEIDAGGTSCTDSSITVYIKNTGTVDFSSVDVNIALQGGTPTACDITAENVVAGGGSIKCDNTLTGSEGNNMIVVSGGTGGPTNTVRATVWCPG